MPLMANSAATYVLSKERLCSEETYRTCVPGSSVHAENVKGEALPYRRKKGV